MSDVTDRPTSGDWPVSSSPQADALSEARVPSSGPDAPNFVLVSSKPQDAAPDHSGSNSARVAAGENGGSISETPRPPLSGDGGGAPPQGPSGPQSRDNSPKPNGPQGPLDICFNTLAWLPMLVLTGIVVLQTWFTLDVRALWFSDEIRYANAYEYLLSAKKWIVLYMNGVPYPDKPPVYFWLLRALHPLVGEASPKLFMLGAAVSGLFFVWATYLLARAVGEDRKTGFAAGLVLLSTFFIVGMMHYSRMDLLFATFITLSHICLFRGWRKESAFGWVIAGFLFAGIATLTKGPLGIAFPVLSTVLFAMWRLRGKRLLGWDVAIGFGLMTALCLTWVAAAYFTEDPDYLRNIFQQQIVKRATDTWHHAQPWWFYFGALAAIMTPWTLMLVTVPWQRLFSAGFYKNIWATRQPEHMGIAYLWITVLSGFALLSAVSIKLPVYLLPTLPALAILIARGLRDLSPGRSQLLFRLFAILFSALGIGVLYAQFIGTPFHVSLDGWYYLVGVAAVAATILWFAAPRRALGGLLLLTLLVTAFILPLGMLTAPSLDGIMSPKAQAEVMREYIDKGYAPATYQMYSGTYSYYAGAKIFETKSWDTLSQFMQEHPNTVIGLRLKHWESWPDRPVNVHIVHRQIVVDPHPSNEFLLVVRSAPQDAASTPDTDPAPGTGTLSPGADTHLGDAALNSTREEAPGMLPSVTEPGSTPSPATQMPVENGTAESSTDMPNTPNAAGTPDGVNSILPENPTSETPSATGNGTREIEGARKVENARGAGTIDEGKNVPTN